VTFTVVNVTKGGFAYTPPTNHDPDGDSDGTTIVVVKSGGAQPTSTPAGPSPTPTRTPTATPAPGPMHSGDLDGKVVGSGPWNARAEVIVHSAGHAPVPGVYVAFSYGGAVSGQTSCVTNSSGFCYVLSKQVAGTSGSVTFTIMSMTKGGFTYTASANHDPDGDSDGTTIVVMKSGGAQPTSTPAGPSPTPTRTPTATPAPGPMHTGDLDGKVVGSGPWNARAEVIVHSAGHAPVPGVYVAFSYGGAVSGQTSCVTNSSGFCYVLSKQVGGTSGSVTFTIMSMTKGGFTYTASANHDPDGDSDGTAITVTKQ
jgi:hypothetical protein